MRKMSVIALVAVLAFAVTAQAQYVNEVFEVPRISQPPTLDGMRGADEWAGALQLECSVSVILSDGAELGWLDIENQSTVRSVNQLNQSEGEDASVARTDADVSTQIFHAWDGDAMYYLGEVTDNVHDVEGGGEARAWWERDSFSLYIDLQNTKEEVTTCCDGPYTALNIVNFMGAPQSSSAISVTWERTIQNVRETTNDPDVIEGFEYGYSFVEDEFGGEADYVIEGAMPWETFQRFNLPATPTVGTEIGFEWLVPDPDGDDGYGGQIQCYGWADNPASFSTWLMSDAPAGPGAGTAVTQDSWGRVKATFNQ